MKIKQGKNTRTKYHSTTVQNAIIAHCCRSERTIQSLQFMHMNSYGNTKRKCSTPCGHIYSKVRLNKITAMVTKTTTSKLSYIFKCNVIFGTQR